MLYFFLGPLMTPLVCLLDGWRMAFNVGFIGWRVSFFAQTVQFILTVGIVATWLVLDNSIEWIEINILFMVISLRAITISLKYAYLPAS